jgi:hypothetical protein
MNADKSGCKRLEKNQGMVRIGPELPRLGWRLEAAQAVKRDGKAQGKFLFEAEIYPALFDPLALIC